MASENDTNAQEDAQGATSSWRMTTNPIALFFADTAACIRFFSRMPMARVNNVDDPMSLPDFTRVARAAPLAGVFVALPAAGLGLALGSTSLPPLATALLVVAALAIVTGALHEDGLADVADGFFGGHTAERRLEIMKDSRIGAFGTIALVLSLGLKASLLAALITRFGAADAMVTLLGIEAVSRALMVWQWSILPPARRDGLAARFGIPNMTSRTFALSLGSICLIPSIIELPVLAILTGLGLSILASLSVARLAVAKIGGGTGDVLGAIQQISSLAFLIGLLLLP